MHAVIIMVGRTDHPCWVNTIFSMSCFSSFLLVASWVILGCEWGLDHGCCSHYAYYVQAGVSEQGYCASGGIMRIGVAIR